jgi:hypothetical protein
MKKSFFFATMLIAASTFSLAGDRDPGRLFASLPTPPATISAAVSQIRITNARRPAATAPAYDAVIREVGEAEKAVGTASAQQQINQTGLDIDFQRMQTDPAYAAKVQERMAGMSDAEKMAAVQHWQAAQSFRGRPASDLTAHARVVQSYSEQKAKNDNALREIVGIYRTAMREDAARHEAVDQEIEAALEKCPTDNTGMEKAWPCAGPLKHEALRRHREAERRSLGEENAAYAKARAMARTRVDELLPLMTAAKQGGQASDTAMVSGQIGEFTRTLASFGRAIALKAAFWGEPRLSSQFINSTQLRFFVQTRSGREVEWPAIDDL